MKSLMRLLLDVLRECGTLCGVSTTRDEELIACRTEHEGLSFLTITLPTFGKTFESSLDRGHFVAPCELPSFKYGGGLGLPSFLRGFLELVFDSRSGELLDEPSVEAIFAVRQITLMLGKVKLPTTSRRREDALSRYVECERELAAHEPKLSEDLLRDITRFAAVLWGDVFDRLNREVDGLELTPAHGPGSTAEKLLGNEKYNLAEWTTRLEEYFPSVDYILPSHRHWRALSRVQFTEPGQERPVRVVTVPKTLKTPRIIAIEPRCMQYTQQALARRLVELLEGTDNPYRSFVGFLDQTVSHRLAEESSSNSELATLDLSEASDRVSNLLVEALLKPWPALSGAVQACRSTRADVPGHGVLPLVKFASMGSALCFPIEALVFTTIVFIALHGSNSSVNRGSLLEYLGRVRVYGDDIIVPADSVSDVIAALEAFGLKVNSDKSFWTGKFRETCGKEYYDGHDVSIVKVRRVLPRSRRDTPEVVSAVSYRNQLYMAGLWRSAKAMDKRIASVLSSYPTVLPTSVALGRHSVLGYQTDKVCPKLHRPLVKASVVAPVPRRSPLNGLGALLKSFLHRGSDPMALDHLEYYGRPVSVRTKTRWVTPY